MEYTQAACRSDRSIFNCATLWWIASWKEYGSLGRPFPMKTTWHGNSTSSPGTIRKALDLLESERLVTRRQGRGTFVNDQSSEELAVRFIKFRDPKGEPLVGDVKSVEISEEIRQ